MVSFAIGDVMRQRPFGVLQHLVVDINAAGTRIVIARPGVEVVCTPSNLILLAKATK